MEELLNKVNNLNTSSGPFDCTLILGNVLKSQNEKFNNIPDVPIFFTNGSKMFGTNFGTIEIMNNFTMLNGCGIHELSNGLRLGFISGNESLLSNEKDQIFRSFENSDGKCLDILLTRHLSKAVGQTKNNFLGYGIIDEVVKIFRPKYHFTSDYKTFFELDPFKWEKNGEYTRTINLAEFGSGSKWAYAFNLEMGNQHDTISAKFISNPYLSIISHKRPLQESSQEIKHEKKAKRVLPVQCHFCLSNPNVQTHMIVSISEYVYITIAKGPLSVPKFDMNFSGHCLIIPIEHIPKFNHQECSIDNILDTPLGMNMKKVENSIVEMNYKNYRMSTVVFEINSENSIHFHKQIVPIPQCLIEKFDSSLERQTHLNNEKHINNTKLDFKMCVGFQDDFLSLINDYKNNYMQFTVYETNTSIPKVYFSMFSLKGKLDLQFGRRVVAFLLNLPMRIKWNSQICYQTKEEEEKEVIQFREAYKDFELTNR